MSKKTITYKGKTLNSAMWNGEISDELFNSLKEEYFKKPNFELVENELIGIHNNKNKVSNITKYYFRELMSKTKQYCAKWTIEDVFNCKEILEHFYWKTKRGYSIFDENKPDIYNLETALRIGGGGRSGIAVKPSNFPIKSVDEILKKYNINNIYYDFSCGWGNRMLGALRNNITYLGTDPNYLLIDKLNEMGSDYNNVNNTNLEFDIRCCGSEDYQKDWKNKIGLAFSSPPYYCLEDYKIGKQSYKEGVSYQDWLNDYMKQTLLNIYEYLISNGVLAINVKNFDIYNLQDDVIKIAEEIGFELIEYVTLKNIKRVVSKKKDSNDTNFYNNDEKILIFKKRFFNE